MVIFMKELTFNQILKLMKKQLDQETNNILDYLNDGIFASHLFEDEVIQVSNDIKKNSETFKKLYSRRALYIVRVNEDLLIPPQFNWVPGGLKLVDSKKVIFDKDSILYVEKTPSPITRMHEHFSGVTGDKASLKLNEWPRDTLLDNITIHIFVLKNKYKNENEIILGGIESRLEKLLNPAMKIDNLR